ncbi:hypothetical protein D3C78_1227190 [compost metagenome]
MMLLSNITDRFRYIMGLKHLNAISGVSHNNRFAQLRINRVMRIFNIRLVLDKIIRTLRLADIVIERADATQQPICTYCFSRRLRQIANHHAVMIRSRRFR